MNYHTTEFPFDEIRKPSEDYFSSAQEAMKATGLGESHIWSVVDGDEGDCVVYGPHHHWVNVLGFVATKEAHDGETYYEESFEVADDDEDWDDE